MNNKVFNGIEKKERERAFTLIELMIVISIIALLTSMVLVSLKRAREKAGVSKAMVFSQGVQNSLGPDAIVYWSFDEGAGAVAVDSSGNGNNGTIGGAVFSDDTPHKDAGAGGGKYALNFNGATNNYVIRNPINNFPTTEITAEFWIKSSDALKNGSPISYASSGSDNDFLIYNNLNLQVFIRGVSVSTGISAKDGDWHHIVIEWRSSDGRVKAYKNGIESYSGTLGAGFSITQGGSLVIAQEQDSIGGGFAASQAVNGLIDEVRIYNKFLTVHAIRDSYLAGLAARQDIAKK